MRCDAAAPPIVQTPIASRDVFGMPAGRSVCRRHTVRVPIHGRANRSQVGISELKKLQNLVRKTREFVAWPTDATSLRAFVPGFTVATPGCPNRSGLEELCRGAAPGAVRSSTGSGGGADAGVAASFCDSTCDDDFAAFLCFWERFFRDRFCQPQTQKSTHMVSAKPYKHTRPTRDGRWG